MQRFIGLATLLLIVKGADILTTWLYTPDFSLTINPFRSLLPLWGFFVYQALALILLWLGMFFYLARPFPRVPNAETQSEFWSIALFGKKIKAAEWFTKTPNNWAPLGSLLGFLAVFVALPVGNISIISNILCVINSGYLAFYLDVGQTLLNSISAFAVVIAAVVFLRIQFKAQSNQQGNTGSV